MQTQKYSSYENRFYKNKYLISLYDEDDFLVGTFKNCREVARFLGRTVQHTAEAIGRCSAGKVSKIYDNENAGRYYTVYFTDVSKNKEEFFYC